MRENVLETGESRTWVRMQWQTAGQDIFVVITGGERPHIGAIALAYPDGDTVSVSCSSVPGHKEDAITRAYAEDVCRSSGCTVAVSCGIHIDNATPDEITVLCENVRLLQIKLKELLQN